MSLCPPSWNIAARDSVFVAMAVSLVVLQIGCAESGMLRSTRSSPQVSDVPADPTLESVPDWALANTHRDDESEIGIGLGETLDRATRSALQDVASRLAVSVESQLRDVYREVDGVSAESLEQIIETRVLGTRFHGWERTRSVQSRQGFWVEVRIDRRRLVRDSIIELSELSFDVDARLESARGRSLARLVALQATARDRDRVSALVSLIDTLDPTFDRGSWIQRIANWRLIDESARRSLIFEVRSDPASREIAHWLESRLASERFMTRAGNCESGHSVCIDIHSEIVETDIANRHVAKIRSFFSILEPGGSVIREVDLTGRGNSLSDREHARRRAMDNLRSNFQTSNVLSSLIKP